MTPSSTDEPTTIRSITGRMPDTLRPMLAASAPEPFDSRDHIFELMWGGIRTVAFIRDGHVRLCARNGRDLSPAFPELRDIPSLLNAREAILDGEITAVDSEGAAAFEALRPRLHALLEHDAPPPDLAKPRRVTGQLCYQAFDVTWMDGRSLADRPLWQRKNRLHDAIRPATHFSAVDFVADDGIAFYEAVVQRRLEGVVAKEKTSLYVPGRRSKSWLEIRALHSGDFVIGGFTFGGARRKGEPFSQLLLGAYDGDRLDYVGAVSGGFTDAEARQIIALLEPLVVPESAFHDPPPIPRLIYWTQPSLVCRVRYSEWSRDGYLRFPIFSALRPDLDPEHCTAE